ncbi:MAG TPA: DNA gyrase subunit A, partial [Trueperaceae bacterium]|nr:DNA gyrase subunit A [Trueperaceae bacterium]
MNEGQVVQVQITDEIKKSFINYAMSVIVDRALPDVRDGLKPVQRRILYAMQQMGLNSTRKHSKSAGVVGEVIGKYHPHGDSAIYEAMVRMAQPWNLRYTLVDGQGNFGSIDGDPAAAYRYTEARLTTAAEALLADIEKETVTFRDNYDGSYTEPEVLPSAIPNLVVNGAAGIAVGMATNLAPHNLNEVIDALQALIKDPQATTDEIMKHIHGPDFPTGGIMNREGIRQAIETGRGSIRVRGRARIEERNGRSSIIVTEIPYQVNKTSLIQTVAQLVRAKKIENISTLRDESDRQGMRIVFEIKRGERAEPVLNQLYKYTQLQSTFSVNNVVIVDRSPRLLPMREMLTLFLEHRADVTRKRSLYELKKARERAHILEGYLIALDNLDAVIALIRSSKDGPEARDGLMREFGLSEVQAQAVLDMRLQRLTGLEREKINEEYRELQEEIARLELILGTESEMWRVISDELQAIRKQFGDARRTQIVDMEEDLDKEDLIPEEPMVVTVTRGGYIKRTALTSYRSQARGGRGVTTQKSKEDDVNSILLVGSTHDFLLYFSDRGRVYRERIFELPELERATRGNFIRGVLPSMKDDENLQTVLALKSFDVDGYFIFATRNGLVKRTAIREYGNINNAGLVAINLLDDDELVAVRIADGNADIVLGTSAGQAIRFAEDDVRDTGRATQGVIGIRLRRGDSVVSMVVVQAGDKDTAELLSVTESGLGKRTVLSEYPLQGRGGQGVIGHKLTDRTGNMVSLSQVLGTEELFVLSEQGDLIRTSTTSVSVYGRSSQG